MGVPAAKPSPRRPDRKLRSSGARLVRGLVRRAGFELVPVGRFDIVRRDYYSPVPDLSRVPETIWTRRSDLGGVQLAPLGQHRSSSQRELAPFIAELDIPVNDPGVPGEFFLRNEYFEAVDAELLYGMVRAIRPARVIELGSGYTTLLINMACRRNASARGAHRARRIRPVPTGAHPRRRRGRADVRFGDLGHRSAAAGLRGSSGRATCCSSTRPTP